MTPFGFPLDRAAVHLNENGDFHSDLPDHAEAFASILENYAQLVRHGISTEDIAIKLLPIVRMAARRV